jgi:hypothetical protein
VDVTIRVDSADWPAAMRIVAAVLEQRAQPGQVEVGR